jgi:hypothetical protein
MHASLSRLIVRLARAPPSSEIVERTGSRSLNFSPPGARPFGPRQPLSAAPARASRLVHAHAARPASNADAPRPPAPRPPAPPCRAHAAHPRAGGGSTPAAAARPGDSAPRAASGPRLSGLIGRSARRQRLPGEPSSAWKVAGAEVDEQGPPVRFAHQDVVTFDVPVHTARRMHRLQGASQHPAHLPARRCVLLGPGVQGRALHPLHEVRVLGSGSVAQHAHGEPRCRCPL